MLDTNEPIRSLLDHGPIRERARRNAERGQLRFAARRRRATAFKASVVAASCALLVLFGLRVQFDSGRTKFLLLADGNSWSRTSGGGTAVFGDGSRLDVAHGAATPVSNDARHMNLRLRGEALFDIVPGGLRQWSIRCSTFDVTVLGTRFVVVDEPHREEVRVERGVVRVDDRLGGVSVVLHANEVWRRTAPSASAPEVPTAVSSDAPIPTPPERRRGRPAVASAQPAAEDEPEVDVCEQTFTRAEDERRTHRPSEAEATFERALLDCHGDPRAALAAVALGRLRMDVLENPEGALAAFELANVLGVPLPLRPDLDRRLLVLRQP
jgi:FecR protein